MSLPYPTSKLNEFDHLIIYRLAVERGCGTEISDLRTSLEELWRTHNLKFKRTKLQIPSWNYFYDRLEFLVLIQYVNKVGKKAYRLNWEHKKDILDYIVPYVRVNYNLKDGDV